MARRNCTNAATIYNRYSGPAGPFGNKGAGLGITQMNAESGTAVSLEVAGLGFSYGAKRALDDVGFTVETGEFKVLLGPNGAGKTTLFSLATRLFHAHTGRMELPVGSHSL